MCLSYQAHPTSLGYFTANTHRPSLGSQGWKAPAAVSLHNGIKHTCLWTHSHHLLELYFLHSVPCYVAVTKTPQQGNFGLCPLNAGSATYKCAPEDPTSTRPFSFVPKTRGSTGLDLHEVKNKNILNIWKVLGSMKF